MSDESTLSYFDDGLPASDSKENMSETDFIGGVSSLLNGFIAFDWGDNDISDFMWCEGDFFGPPIGDFPMQIDEGIIDKHNHFLSVSKKPISWFPNDFFNLEYILVDKFFFPLVDIIVFLLEFSLITEHLLLGKIEIFSFFILKHATFSNKFIIVFGVKIVII